MLTERSNTSGQTAMKLETSMSNRVTGKDGRGAGMANKPARAAPQVNQRNRRESVPFAAALKSP